ncbi:hypothetical protein K492DRAFT_190940 [Lichtheimia hyalospora FSU 10163]|nr:hypothetical protein K492DRAFT_190940 [Lichtheimia hyalospora FSU 10163]
MDSSHPPLNKSRSRLFKPKKMKSLNKLFTSTTTNSDIHDPIVDNSAPTHPIIVSPNGSGSSPDTPSPSSTIFTPTNIRQYPPKPLVYSDDINPPPENVIKSRKSCTLKNDENTPTANHHAIKMDSLHRRSSEPTFMPATSKNRVFSFFRSSLR